MSAITRLSAAWLAALYLALASVCLLYAWLVPGEAFRGLPLFVVTMPWSFITTFVMDSISPGLFDGDVGLWILAVEALVNALIIYLLVRRQRGKRESAGLPTN